MEQQKKYLRHRFLDQYNYVIWIKFHIKKFRSSSLHVNVLSNIPTVVQNHKQNADIAYYGLYDQNKIQN